MFYGLLALCCVHLRHRVPALGVILELVPQFIDLSAEVGVLHDVNQVLHGLDIAVL